MADAKPTPEEWAHGRNVAAVHNSRFGIQPEELDDLASSVAHTLAAHREADREAHASYFDEQAMEAQKRAQRARQYDDRDAELTLGARAGAFSHAACQLRARTRGRGSGA